MAPPKLISSGMQQCTKESEENKRLANRYRVISKLASGSYGTVFLVSDARCGNGELKVLKKIPIGDLEPDETISAVNEAHLLSKLDHPGIVKFHDNFIDEGFFCIVTEYCEGGDLDVKLHSWKKNGKEVDGSLVLTWFIQLVLGVQYMHQRRVLHRDLKTRNVFLKNNMIKIGDLGISRILMGTTDVATTFTGTPYFMAPEILKHEGYNSKSDIWSLGVILYEMCSLKRAFQGNSLMSVMFKIVEGEIPPLPSRFEPELQDIYMSMMQKDPSGRISASEILKTPFIMKHLEKLKFEISNNLTFDKTKARQEAAEIAKVFSRPKKKKQFTGVRNDRPNTPKEQLKLRKQQKADEEAERLKKITVSLYVESRRKYSRFKQREAKVTLPFVTNNNENSDKNSNISKPNNLLGEEQDHVDNTDGSLSVVDLKSCDNQVIEKARRYTHCFGEDDTFSTSAPDIVQSHDNVRGDKMSPYTHVFGNDDSGSEEDVFEETFPSDDALVLTNISTIPDDATLADTYYSTYDDFESSTDDSSEEYDKTNDEYSALVGCMQDALDLTESDMDSTFGDGTSSTGTSTYLRKQKINSLRRECVHLLGQDGFHRAYNFLNKARFGSSTSMNEEVIMNQLRKLVGNTRDCFLVDQLLFLEKQNQICAQSL